MHHGPIWNPDWKISTILEWIALIEYIYSTDYKLHDFEYDVDPENQLRSSLNSKCDYYTEEQFKGKVSLENKFSVIQLSTVEACIKTLPKYVSS